jgi:5-oxoprolinase (ATP-hydrolysing)
MRPAQKIISSHLFNRGGTLKEIRDRCLQETGLAPPVPPSSKGLTGAVARLQHIRDLYARRAVEDAEIYRPSDVQTKVNYT